MLVLSVSQNLSLQNIEITNYQQLRRWMVPNDFFSYLNLSCWLHVYCLLQANCLIKCVEKVFRPSLWNKLRGQVYNYIILLFYPTHLVLLCLPLSCFRIVIFLCSTETSSSCFCPKFKPLYPFTQLWNLGSFLFIQYMLSFTSEMIE